jgi:hypothetical protein
MCMCSERSHHVSEVLGIKRLNCLTRVLHFYHKLWGYITSSRGPESLNRGSTIMNQIIFVQQTLLQRGFVPSRIRLYGSARVDIVEHTNCVWRVIFLFFLFSHGLRLSPLGTAATVWPIAPAPDDRWWWLLWSNLWNANWQGKQKYSERTCPSDPLSTTNRTYLDSGSNPGRRHRLTAWTMSRLDWWWF